MQNQNETQQAPCPTLRSAIPGITRTFAALALAACLAPATRAGNVLQNPGFEQGSGLVNWTAKDEVSWPLGPASGQGKLYHAGNNALWMQGEYGNPSPDLIYEYQTIACAPGSTFTADAFFSQYVSHDGTVGEGGDPSGVPSGLFTSDSSGEEDGWVEVAFLNSANQIVADYKSVIITPAYESTLPQTTVGAQTIITWLDCQVTNQYDVSQLPAGTVDPATYAAAITNTLAPGQYMVAPPGTAKVQFRLAIFQNLYESGATYWDDATLNLIGGPAPSVISNVSPDGSHFFNNVPNGFTFTITSASSGGAPLPSNPTNGVKVVVNGTDQSSHLVFSGDPQNWNVALPTVTSNMDYTISITVSNSAGLQTVDNVSFDTFNTNAFVVYVEDYDFTNGLFIQNPTPTNAPGANSYWGTAGTAGVDQNAPGSVSGGGSTLQPNYPNRTDGNVAFQVSTDLQMPLYTAQSNSAIYNVNLSYNNGGNWENYTRNPYPQGASVAFARISGGGGYGVEYLNLVTGGYGTPTQTTARVGQFVLANGTDWGTYYWIPLTDPLGNMVVFNIPAGQQTLQLLSGGGVNVIDFLIVPAGSVALPPVISNLNPPLTASTAFLGGITNLTFNAGSSQSTIPTTNVTVTLNGTSVPVSVTGNSTNRLVSVALPQNQVLTLGISVTDANGLNKTVSYSVDTFYQTNFMFEAEDFDFNGGQFIDNPVPTAPYSTAVNSYFTYPEGNNTLLAIENVDYTDYQLNAGEQYLYRPLENVGTEIATDFVRQKFINESITNNDYDVGWWNAGTWLNYTRTYPTGNFNVWGRLAAGGAYTGLTLSQVTSGAGTSTQTTKVLGTFSDPNANGWQNWHWIPLLDSNGNKVVVSFNGVETLQATGSGQNANFYMLVPVATQPNAPQLSASVSTGSIVINIPTQLGFTYTVMYKNHLSDSTWTPLGGGVAGTGSTVSVTNSMAQAQQYFKVSVQ